MNMDQDAAKDIATIKRAFNRKPFLNCILNFIVFYRIGF